MPIRLRLTLWYSLVLALIIVAIGAFLMWRLRADLMTNLDAALVTQADQVRQSIEDPDDPAHVVDLEEVATTTRDDELTQVYGRDGELRRSSRRVLRALITPVELETLQGGRHAAVEIDSGTFFRGYVTRLDRSGSYVLVARSTEPIAEATNRLLLLLALAVPVAIGAAALGGYVLARRALRPVDRMTHEAAAIGADDTDSRLDVPKVNDEIGRLGTTLNAMLDRLQTALNEQRRFTSDASHELRTPLSIMQGEIEVALRSASTSADARPPLESVAEETARMQEIVENLLALARLDEARSRSHDDVDIGALASSVADRLRPTAGERTLTVTDPVRASIVGNAGQIDLLLSNLVSNAIKYTGAGGRIDVAVTNGDRTVRIDVTDDGVGIPGDALPHVFDRFYRVDKARSRAAGGTGLGLAICQAIVTAHNGTIEVRSVPGTSTVFTVTLPSS